MSDNKVGAYIVLDGEKEFKDNVSACNKELGALKSGLNLLEAQTIGQANTLDTLTKKQNILTESLESQRKKELAVREALEHARKDYERVGGELDEYKGKLKDAKESLEKLKNSSEESSEELEEQKKKVKELENIVEKGANAFVNAEKRVSSWKKQLNNAQAQTLRATRALNENKVYLEEAEKSYTKCAKSIDKFGDKTESFVDKLLKMSSTFKVEFAESVYEAGESLLQNGVQNILQMEDAVQKLQASTGANTKEMRGYSAVLKELYEDGYAESIEELAGKMALVRQNTGEIDADALKKLTENTIALEDTFDNMDMTETLRGADALMKSMGLSAEEAFDYIATGAQNGLNKSGELADNLAEYVPLWQQAGFSAQEMFTILDNGLDAGAYNLDKVNDFVKEFGNSMADGRIEKSLDSFSDGTKDLFYQWKTGEASTKDVFYSVINDLQLMTNKQEALTVASNVWSSLGEDNAMDVIVSLNKVNDTFTNVKGSMERLKEVRYDSLKKEYEQLGRTIQTEIIYPTAEKALPLARNFIGLLADHEVAVKSLVGVITAGFIAIKADKFATDIGNVGKNTKKAGVAVLDFVKTKVLKTAVTTAETTAEVANTTAVAANTTAVTAQAAATTAATVAQEGLNLAMYANPAALAIGGIVALTAVVVGLTSEIQLATGETGEFCEKSKELSETVKKETNELRQSYEGLTDSIESVGAKEMASNRLLLELYDLEDVADKSGTQIARMSSIVDELNTIFPNLSLSVDKNTGALNKNRQQAQQSIDTYLNYAKIQAAQEKMAEIARELTDADIARYETEQNLAEIEQKLASLEQERKSLLEESSGAAEMAGNACGQYAASLSVEETALGKNASQMTALKEAQKEQKIALEEMNEAYAIANEKYAEAYEYTESLTESSKKNTEAVISGAEAKNEASRASIEQVGQETEAYNSLSAAQQDLAVNVTNSVLAMQESVQSSLQSQMSMFEEFDAGVSISTENLLSNMQSQIDGVTEWEENLAALMEKTKTTADGAAVAIDEGLMQYLASLGPEGAGYVQAFVNMSGDELAKANALWQEKIAIENFANEAGVRLTDSVGTLAAGGAEAFAQLGSELNMKANEAGAYGVQGLVNGMTAAQEQAEVVGRDLGIKVIDSLNEGLGCHSPSEKAEKSGINTDEGLVHGMELNMPLVKIAGTKLGNTAIQGLEDSNLYEAGKTEGGNFAEGMRIGILLKTQSVAKQAADMVSGAITAAKEAQDSNSPAKETIKVGHDFGSGAEIGIVEKIPNVERASERMIDTMLSTVSSKTKEARELLSSVVNIKDINGTVERGDSPYKTEEFIALQSWFERRMRNMTLTAYIDGRQVTRALSDRGVVFSA